MTNVTVDSDIDRTRYSGQYPIVNHPLQGHYLNASATNASSADSHARKKVKEGFESLPMNPAVAKAYLGKADIDSIERFFIAMNEYQEMLGDSIPEPYKVSMPTREEIRSLLNNEAEFIQRFMRSERINHASVQYTREFFSQFGDQILKRMSTGNNPDTYSQLEQLFEGKLDTQTLESLVSNVDAELQKVTTQTNSTGVIRFDIDGRVGYGKVSTKREELQNEQNALAYLRQDPIARVLTPVPIGLVTHNGAAAMFTWGTENTEQYSQEDLQAYFNLFNNMLIQYSKERNIDFDKLAADPTIRDTFNRAVINSAVKDYQSLNERPDIIELDQLEERAEGAIALRTFSPIYQDAAERAKTLNPGNPVFLHGDARPEKIGKNSYGIRPLVDWANAKMGTFVVDFSTLGTRDSQKYLDFYKYVLENRGVDFIQEDSKELVICHGVLQPYREAASMLSMGRYEEAIKNIRRLERNASRYQECFMK